MSSFELEEHSPRLSRGQAKKGLAMDMVLVLVGGSTVWLVNRYLSFDDSRPLHNAWTYLVAIPLGLVAVDMLLRTVVSRFIERTLQIAFLLSVFVHLLMTMGAINVEIFGRSQIAQQTKILTSSASAQQQTSSVPEYTQSYSQSNSAKPDYLRPVATDETDAASSEANKQSIDHPSTIPAPVQLTETTIETPQASLTKADAKRDDPEIQSERARFAKPDLAATIPEPQSSIEIPEAKNTIALDEPLPLQAEPTDVASPKPKSVTSLVPLRVEHLEPNPLSSLEPKLSLSKSPNRRVQADFELPAIEDRKTDLAKRDLSPGSAARVLEPAFSSVPLLDSPKSVDGEFANQLPADTLDKPSDVGDRIPSVGNRKLDSTIGGSISSAALDGWAEAGGLRSSPGFGSARATTPTPSRRQGEISEVEITGALIPKARSKPSFGVAPPKTSSVPLPEGSGRAEKETSSQAVGDNLAASSVDSKKRTLESTTSGGRETLRGPALGLDDVRLSVDISRSANRELAASGGRKAAMPELEPSFDLPGLIGAKRMPRLSSASPTPNAPSIPIPVPAFQQRMSRNDGTDDAADLGKLGPATEAAIERGLEFLAKHQRSDGSWQLEDFGDRPRLRSHTAATALSLLAFQGAGYSHRQYHYAPVCKSALEFLLAHQQPDGDLYIPMDEASNANARFYSHSIASLALCEAFGMTQDEALREPAQRAVQFMVKTQDPVGGGWRYLPGVESDTSVSGWYMMALKSAELSGLEVPKSTFDNIKGWLDKAQASPEERHLYRYNPLAPDSPMTRHGRIPNPTMTGVGLLMRLYLGWRRNTPEMIRGADYLLENLPAEGTQLDPKRDTYYWYYATQVLFHMGSERWKRWNGELYPLLIRSQQLDGDQVGSWDPSGPIPDRWGPFAGRLYVTTLNLLSLEVYYRHLPIYEDTAR